MNNLNNELLSKILDLANNLKNTLLNLRKAISKIDILKEKIEELPKKNQNNVSKPLAKDIPNYEELDNDLLDLIVNLNKIIN